MPALEASWTNTARLGFRGSFSLLQLLIPYFYYLPALGSPESSHGYGNWPMRPSGGDYGEGMTVANSAFTKKATVA